MALSGRDLGSVLPHGSRMEGAQAIVMKSEFNEHLIKLWLVVVLKWGCCITVIEEVNILRKHTRYV
jgi:predicted SpoU family rRNA methylase